MKVSRIALSAVMAILGSTSVAHGFESEKRYLSVVLLTENLKSENLVGGRVAWVLWEDEHAPPLFLSAGAEYVAADGGGGITRVTGALTFLSFPGNSRWSVVLKPILGFEYDDFDGNDFGVVAGAGAEFAVRPTRGTHVTIQYNWLQHLGENASNQFGLGYRFSF